MMNIFQYENETSGMETDLSWEMKDDMFFISTITYRDGRPYNHMSVRCAAENGGEHMESVVAGLLKNGFKPVEQM
jgi:hypothetical protein